MQKQKKLPMISKDEMNLAEFPLSWITYKLSPSQKTIEYENQTVNKEGEKLKQTWIVTGSDKYGLPTPYDNDIIIALMAVYKKQGILQKTIYFSIYELIKIMRRELTKEQYTRVKQTLNRLVSTTLFSENTFWDNEKKKHLTWIGAFHLFEKYELFDGRVTRKRKNQLQLSTSYIVMSDILFNSIKAGYFKDLNIEFYFNLGSPLSKRLYRYLDKKLYQKQRFEIGLQKLANILPLTERYPSCIKRTLNKVHNELLHVGYLENVHYRKDKGQNKVIYIKNPNISLSSKSSSQFSLSHIDLSNFPCFQNINSLFLKGLCNEFGGEKVSNTLDMLQFQYTKSRRKIDSPEALLYSVLTNPNFIPPRDYVPIEEREKIKRQRELREIQEAQEQDEQERDAKLRCKANAILDTLKEEELKKLEEQAHEAIKEDLLEMKNSPLFEQISKVLIKAQMVEIIKARFSLGKE